MFKVFPLTLALAAVLLPGCGGGTVESADRVEVASVEKREPAPDFTLQDAHGRDVSLSELRDKVVLLNFWATWCGPCKIEMPWFVEFQRKYKDRGFTVVAVSLDEEGWEVVKPFAEQLNLNFPVVVGTDEMGDKFGGVTALPTTFMIDIQGRIASQHTGLVSKGTYEEEIEKLL
jgi:cytochrome c biogenesis protein CcmG/thiol:disulfide interchange protein DsbE